MGWECCIIERMEISFFRFFKIFLILSVMTGGFSGLAAAQEDKLFTSEDACRAKVERLEAEVRDKDALIARLQKQIELYKSIASDASVKENKQAGSP